MSQRTRTTFLVVLLLLILAGAAGFVYEKSPPRAARLLPEADAIVFANLQPIRLATHIESKPVPHSPDYQHFIDATGIVFERDLDQVAFALHRIPDASGPNGGVAFSEVFVGRFDAQRFAAYLASVATSRESYAGHDIYTIPVGLPAGPTSHIIPTGRLLRVTQLSPGTIAASNAPTAEQIHAMLDHTRAAASPLGGPTVLTGLYPEVPLFSAVWGIGQIGLPFAEAGRVSAFGLHLPLPDTTPFVASLRYTTSLHLRIEQIAGTEADARRSAERITTLLGLFRQMQQLQLVNPNDMPVRQVMSSLKIEQHGDRAILTAEIPLELLRRISSPALAAAE